MHDCSCHDQLAKMLNSTLALEIHSYYLLPSLLQYVLNPESGLFRHHSHHPSKERNWLSSISYKSGEMTHPKTTLIQPSTPISYQVHVVSFGKI